MTTKAGVWIDHKQAVIVLLTDTGTEIKKTAFDIGQRIRSKAGSRSKNPYKPGKFVAEDTLERKLGNDRSNYYDDVIASMRGAKAILILGPGEAKGEFLKRLQSKKLRSVDVEIETVDKMTDRQIAAKVARHFAAPKISKSINPKMTAKKKATRATTGQRKKKS
jgi:stalled ribosome rescue protein Dom34